MIYYDKENVFTIPINECMTSFEDAGDFPTRIIFHKSHSQSMIRKRWMKKKIVVIVLLDVRQAYDKVGYEQERIAMESQPLPYLLRKVLNLDRGNFTEIITVKGKTKRIYF